MNNNNKGLLFYWPLRLQEAIAVVSTLGMIAGLMWSRALLSVCMIILLVNALHPEVRRQAWQRYTNNRFAQSCVLFFLIYLVSGIWSADLDSWWAGTFNKLPFLILPFSFFSIPLQRPKVQRVIITGIVLMHVAVISYSLYCLWRHPEFYIEGYAYSKQLPTTKYNDHIRFSITLVLTTLTCFYLLFDHKHQAMHRGVKVFLGIASLLFIVYVHLLAAKSGLVCLYILLMGYGFSYLYRSNRLMAYLLLAGIALLPLAAYRWVPTFQKKVDYVKYEVDKSMEDQHFDYSLSDAGRMITYDIGLRAIAAQPWLGVGAGDLMQEMRKGYELYYPEVPVYEQYGPINQFLYTALCVGIPLSLAGVWLAFTPVFYRGANRLYVVISALVLLFSLMVEAMLELQFGVFTYLFFILFWLSASADQPVGKTTQNL